MPDHSVVPSQMVSIVTGGSRGIGAAICIALAERGDDVHLIYRDNSTAAGGVAAWIAAAGGRCTTWQCDVSNEPAVTATIAEIEKSAHRIDAVINNAGIVRDSLLAATSFDTWKTVIGTNLDGAFLVSRAVVTTMLAQRSGVIINVGSPSAHQAGAGQCAYAASKAGLEGLTRALAAEVGHKGIRINAVNPGRVRTDMTETIADRLGELPGTPEDVAQLICFLTSDDASYINGQIFTVDGGASVRRR